MTAKVPGGKCVDWPHRGCVALGDPLVRERAGCVVPLAFRSSVMCQP